MKKIFLLLALSLSVFAFTSCSDDDDDKTSPAVVTSGYIDATAKNTWNYYSLKNNKLVGSAADTEEETAAWAARKDWDFAVNRYSIRTNSGAATTVGAKGGVFTCPETVKFASLTTMPKDVTFEVDEKITSEGMQGTVTTVKSKATVILFKKNADGSLMMPPVYLKAPVYIMRTADGKSNYKLEFTQYKDENGKSGNVKFNFAELK